MAHRSPSCMECGGTLTANCEACKEENRQRRRRMVANRQQQLAADPTLRTHGDPTTYDLWGCRCQECRTAAAALRLKYKHAKRLPGRTAEFGREWLSDATR